MSLLEKMRRAREQRVEEGGFTFIVRRPTDLDMLELRGLPRRAFMAQVLVGWEGVREIDLVPGGAPEAAPFDSDVAVEWLADRPDLASAVVRAAVAAYDAHAEALKDAAGK